MLERGFLAGRRAVATFDGRSRCRTLVLFAVTEKRTRARDGRVRRRRWRRCDASELATCPLGDRASAPRSRARSSSRWGTRVARCVALPAARRARSSTSTTRSRGRARARRRPRCPRSPRSTSCATTQHLASVNFGVDSGFYPLGSCTMKYNPRVNEWRVPPARASRACTRTSPIEHGPGRARAHGRARRRRSPRSRACRASRCSRPPARTASSPALHGASARTTRRAATRARASSSPTPRTARTRRPSRCAATRSRRSRATSAAASTSTRSRAALDTDVAAIMLTNPNTLGLFDENIVEITRMRARGRRARVLRRREPERDPGQGAPRRHGLRRAAHQPAQDVLHAARRRRPRRRARCASRDDARAVPARPARRCATTTARFGLRDARALDRPRALVPRQRRRARARVRLHPRARRPRGSRRSPSRRSSRRTTSRSGSKGAYDLPYDRTCMHEFVLSGAPAEARARRAHARHRQAAARLRLSTRRRSTSRSSSTRRS